jgi:hypothetical protein
VDLHAAQSGDPHAHRRTVSSISRFKVEFDAGPPVGLKRLYNLRCEYGTDYALLAALERPRKDLHDLSAARHYQACQRTSVGLTSSISFMGWSSLFTLTTQQGGTSELVGVSYCYYKPQAVAEHHIGDVTILAHACSQDLSHQLDLQTWSPLDVTVYVPPCTEWLQWHVL